MIPTYTREMRRWKNISPKPFPNSMVLSLQYLKFAPSLFWRTLAGDFGRPSGRSQRSLRRHQVDSDSIESTCIAEERPRGGALVAEMRATTRAFSRNITGRNNIATRLKGLVCRGGWGGVSCSRASTVAAYTAGTLFWSREAPHPTRPAR